MKYVSITDIHAFNLASRMLKFRMSPTTLQNMDWTIPIQKSRHCLMGQTLKKMPFYQYCISLLVKGEKNPMHTMAVLFLGRAEHSPCASSASINAF